MRHSKRDWSSLREWANVAIALGALLVGIVSVWTTIRISGLEDYFRSEISRRNSDLNALSDQSRRLGALADEREKQLADLQTTTGRITASNLAAQGKLISTEQELGRLGLEVLTAQQKIARSEARLSSLSAQSGEQVNLIDLFRRQRLFEIAYRRIAFGGIWASRDADEKAVWDGEAAYDVVTNWAAGNVDRDLAPYLPELAANARQTCQWIRTYKPELPADQSYGDPPITPGKRIGNGDSVQMSQREYKAWLAARDEWFIHFAEVSKANDAALRARQKARDYLNHAAASCVCRALATAKNSASAICPGYDKPPERPDQ